MKKRFLETLETSFKMMVIWEGTGLDAYHRLWLLHREEFVKAQNEVKGVAITGEEIIEAQERGTKAGKDIVGEYIDYIGYLAGMDEEDYAMYKAKNRDEIEMWESFKAGNLKEVG